MITDIIYIIIKKHSVIVELESILSKLFTFLAPLLCDNFGFIKKIKFNLIITFKISNLAL